MNRPGKKSLSKKRSLVQGLIYGVIFFALLREALLRQSWGSLRQSTPMFLQEPVQLTGGKEHHWFGYFDKWCQNADGFVLVM